MVLVANSSCSEQFSGQAKHIESYYAATALNARDYPLLDESMSCDVCVIGGGLTGLSAALDLSEGGWDVVVLESHRIGWGASGRNGGQVGTGLNQSQSKLERDYGLERAKLLWELCEEAKQLVRRRVERHGIRCDYKRGVVGAAYTSSGARSFEKEIDHLQSQYGSQSIHYLDPRQMEEMFGERGYHGGKMDSDAGHIHPLNYAIGLASAFAEHGGHIFENTPATAIRELPDDAVAVDTGVGACVRSNILVVACNAYLGALERNLARFILPIHSYVIATEPLAEPLAHSINRDDVAVYDSRNDLDYYRLSADKRMLFGAGESYPNELVGTDIEAKVRPRMISLYPELRNARIDYRWSGRIAMTMSRLPTVGRFGQNRYYAQGFSGHGIALTGIVGKTIAETISGRDDRFDAFANARHRKFSSNSTVNLFLYMFGLSCCMLRDWIDIQVSKVGRNRRMLIYGNAQHKLVFQCFSSNERKFEHRYRRVLVAMITRAKPRHFKGSYGDSVKIFPVLGKASVGQIQCELATGLF